MAPGSWTRDDLAALATGRTVRVSGPTGHDYPVPYWLGCAAGEVGDSSVADRVSARYPGDQGRYTEAWRAALANPGERYEVEYRTRLPGREGWWRERASFVNLMDRDDVRGIVVVTEEIGPGEVPRAEGSAIGAGDDDGVVADWILYWLDDQAQVIALDGAAEAIVGIPPEAMVGRSPVEWLHPDGIAELVEVWVHVTENPGSSRTTRQRVVRPDGRERAVDVTVTHRVRDDGTTEYHAVLRDLDQRAEVDAARRDAEHRLARAEQERSLLADGLGQALFRCTPDGEVLTGDARWAALAARAGAQPFGCVFDLLVEDGSLALRAELGLATSDGIDAEPRCVEVTTADGTTVLSFLLRATRFGGGPAVVGAVRDVTDEARGRRRTRHDTVTGLLNRTTLEARLADALAHDRSGTLVVYLDLDHFGAVNDTYGPDAGDEVLEEVAERLRQAVRPGDAVCRYGGDEFVILCHDAADGAAVAVHRRIDEVLAAPIACGGGSWAPSASIGIARPTASEDIADVIRRAGQTAADEKRKRRPVAGTPRTPAP